MATDEAPTLAAPCHEFTKWMQSIERDQKGEVDALRAQIHALRKRYLTASQNEVATVLQKAEGMFGLPGRYELGEEQLANDVSAMAAALLIKAGHADSERWRLQKRVEAEPAKSDEDMAPNKLPASADT